MQLFMLHRMVPSIWLKRQCLEGYFNGKVKTNALSINNECATPKRYPFLDPATLVVDPPYHLALDSPALVIVVRHFCCFEKLRHFY
jgi:hypothetical protein